MRSCVEHDRDRFADISGCSTPDEQPVNTMTEAESGENVLGGIRLSS